MQEEVAKLRAAGLTNQAIADELGISLSYVQKLAPRVSVKRKAGKPHSPIVAEQRERIARMREAGYGPIEIAGLLNLKHTTVRAIVHQLRRSGRLPAGRA